MAAAEMLLTQAQDVVNYIDGACGDRISHPRRTRGNMLLDVSTVQLPQSAQTRWAPAQDERNGWVCGPNNRSNALSVPVLAAPRGVITVRAGTAYRSPAIGRLAKCQV